MRYKLKQTYYGSPEEGTIVEQTKTFKDEMIYYFGANGISCTQDEVENYPHLWERLEDEIGIRKKLFRQIPDNLDVKDFAKAVKEVLLDDFGSHNIEAFINEIKSRTDINEIDNIEWDGIDHNDCPDYCDAYIVSADRNGVPMTEDELDELNEDRDLILELLNKHLY